MECNWTLPYHLLLDVTRDFEHVRWMRTTTDAWPLRSKCQLDIFRLVTHQLLQEFQWCMSMCGVKMSQSKSEAESSWTIAAFPPPKTRSKLCKAMLSCSELQDHQDLEAEFKKIDVNGGGIVLFDELLEAALQRRGVLADQSEQFTKVRWNL